MRKIIQSLAGLALLLAPALAWAKGGVVSAADPRAAEAGRQILREGGSATDAALAMMLALTVVEPQSSGIGGGGFLIVHQPGKRDPYTVDGRETAPASATPALFTGADGKSMGFRQAVPGGRSVGVPGNMALMAMAHRKSGKLAWARLFQPAIRLADEGHVVTPRLAGALKQVAPVWPDFPAARAIYWQDGRPKQAGETVRNPELAAFLRLMARKGAPAFYKGENARKLSQAVSTAPRNAVPMTEADLRGYRAKARPPVCMAYRVYRLCGMGPPSSGATTVFQVLGMLERFDMKALGKDSPEAWHLIGEAMLLAYADRDRYLGDSDFVAVPVAGLLDKAYLAERSAKIAPDKSLNQYEPGTPPGAAPRGEAKAGDVPGTTHFVAVDGRGQIASMTSTVEGPFGSQLLVNGYFLNNELTDFSFVPTERGAPVANRVEPGKRPLSSMAPTIVYGPDGQPIFSVGAAGGRTIIMQVAKALIARLDWGLSAQEAIAAPMLYFSGTTLQAEAGTPLAQMAVPLAQRGHMVMAVDMPRLKANAVEKTDSGWAGAADPRSEGVTLPE